MDRRFFTWLMLTTALCFLYLSMRPQMPPEPLDVNARGPVADPLAFDPLAAASPDADSDTASANPTIAADDSTDASGPTKPQNARKLVTLGSMDARQGFSLMVTLSSRGAGIERAELVARKKDGQFEYRALEHRGGYLGYLGLDDELTIFTIPDGSPAATATSAEAPGGLQVGDRLLQVNGFELLGTASLEEALAETQPGQEVKLVVERGEPGQIVTLNFSTSLSEAPLDVLRASDLEQADVPGNLDRVSLRTTLASLNGNFIPVGQSSFASLRATLESDWAVHEIEVPGGQGVEFRLPLDSFLSAAQPRKIDLVKRYRLMPAGETDGYLLDFETLIVNRNDQSIQASFRQEGLAGLTLEGWWYSVKISPTFSGAGQRDVVYLAKDGYKQQIATTRNIQDHAKDTPRQPDLMIFGEGESFEARSLSYIGLDSQYFNASMLPASQESSDLTDMRQAAASAIASASEIPKSKIQATNTSFWFDTAEMPLAGGEELSRRYQIFIGPKKTEILAHHGLEQTIEYGWFPWIAKPLSAVLHFFYAIVGNYGLAIVMLTLVVRGFMFPLGRKAAANAQRMQELQPELKKINDKYKDNMEKRAKAMQELYAKHNFKPLAGCLPMFIQLPIFIGLYRCLSVDISLRQEPLIPGISWCSNLAGPDMLFNWSSWMPEFIAGKGSGWLGPYFNILPIATVVLFILQQKLLMPKATDDQTRMTQNMMQVMTVFMGVLFFKVPSGLCIYFITSSLWSLLERKLVKTTLPVTAPGTLTDGVDSSETNRTSSRGKGRDRQTVEEKPPGRLQEIMQMLDKPAVKSSTQRGSAKNPRGSKKNRKGR